MLICRKMKKSPPRTLALGGLHRPWADAGSYDPHDLATAGVVVGSVARRASRGGDGLGGVTHVGSLDKPFRYGLKPTVQATMRLGEAQIPHGHARRLAASVDVVKMKDRGGGYWPGLEALVKNRKLIRINRDAMGLKHRPRVRKLWTF